MVTHRAIFYVRVTREGVHAAEKICEGGRLCSSRSDATRDGSEQRSDSGSRREFPSHAGAEGGLVKGCILWSCSYLLSLVEGEP